MDKKQYNNIIDWTLKHEESTQVNDSVDTAKAIFNNMGVALPQGDCTEISNTLKDNDYMGWTSCTAEEAQESANNGTAAIAINDNELIVIAAEDEEEPITKTSFVMTSSDITSPTEIQYYSYNSNTSLNIPVWCVNGWLDLYVSPSISGRVIHMPSGCIPNKWFAFEEKTTINSFALNIIGDTNTVNIGGKGQLFDKDGRYWVAVGPKVINPNHPNNKTVWAEDMKYGTKIDVTLSHANGNSYYLRAVVGDCKVHTYDNGIYQTGLAFPNGTDPHPENADYSIIEFCGAKLSSKLSEFNIVSIIVEE